MKISIIAPPWIPIPPEGYGGIELVVYNLILGLVEAGHEVVMFGPIGSKVPCEVVPYLENIPNVGLDAPDAERFAVWELSRKYAYAMSEVKGVDLIHDHTLAVLDSNLPVVHTLHGPADPGMVDICAALSRKSNNHFVTISDRQKELYFGGCGELNIIGTVHNCVDHENIEWKKDKEDYFFFAGRSNWEKGLDAAVRVASAAKVDLVMAARMTEEFEKEFFCQEIQPVIDAYPEGHRIKLLEEITRQELNDLFLNAKCTLFTSQWEEPFGLVMIESMACGTPVVAFNKGAAAEVIENGKTGFVVEDEKEMVEALGKIDTISPENCRRHIENNFSREKMTRDYINIYERVLGQ